MGQKRNPHILENVMGHFFRAAVVFCALAIAFGILFSEKAVLLGIGLLILLPLVRAGMALTTFYLDRDYFYVLITACFCIVLVIEALLWGAC